MQRSVMLEYRTARRAIRPTQISDASQPPVLPSRPPSLHPLDPPSTRLQSARCPRRQPKPRSSAQSLQTTLARSIEILSGVADTNQRPGQAQLLQGERRSWPRRRGRGRRRCSGRALLLRGFGEVLAFAGCLDGIGGEGVREVWTVFDVDEIYRWQG